MNPNSPNLATQISGESMAPPSADSKTSQWSVEGQTLQQTTTEQDEPQSVEEIKAKIAELEQKLNQSLPEGEHNESESAPIMSPKPQDIERYNKAVDMAREVGNIVDQDNKSAAHSVSPKMPQ